MQEFLNNIIPNVMAKLPDFYAAIGDTLLMVVWSGAISFVLVLALGVLLTVTKPGGILENLPRAVKGKKAQKKEKHDFREKGIAKQASTLRRPRNKEITINL